MFKEKDALLKTNKKTVASMGLISYEATGLLVFKGKFIKVYKISRKEKAQLSNEIIADVNFKFFYISAEGNTHLNFMTLTYYSDNYQEALAFFSEFESMHDISAMDFVSVMNQILEIRDIEGDFTLKSLKKQDLVSLLEQKGVQNSCNFREIELDVYPTSCQSKLLNLLKKMELPYILMIEKEEVKEDDYESINRYLEGIYSKTPDIDVGYIFGKIRLMLFSLDEETLNIASNTITERLTSEGFIASKKPIGDITGYRFMTSLGLIGDSSNTLVSLSTLKAFL